MDHFTGLNSRRLGCCSVGTVGSFSTIDSDDSLSQEFALDGNFERFTSLFLDKQNLAVMDKHLHLD